MSAALFAFLASFDELGKEITRMSRQPSIAVFGAGVVGLATALYLRRSGHAVTVLDPLPPGGGASYGNGGLISGDTVTPIVMPGMLKKLPKWLADPMGPLTLRPEYLPRALPWLLRSMKSGSTAEVHRISDALRALHRDALACWRELLGPAHYADLVRERGQVRLWEGESMGAREFEHGLCRRHGIPVQELDNRALRDLYPDIAPDVAEGLLVPGNAHTVNQTRLVRTLADVLRAEGGAILQQRVLKVVPRGGDFLVLTNESSRVEQRIVVATGAWAKALLTPLRIDVPLDTERGYHALMPRPSVELSIPVLVKNRGFGLTSMETGLCAAGTVEIGGLHAPPNERRAQVLAEHAKRLFPTLETGEATYWMGFRPSLPDSLPVLGAAPGIPGLFLAFGHGHFGLTGGPPSARLVAQMIAGEPPAIDPAPYACTRFR